jgi:hypothetical protein
LLAHRTDRPQQRKTIPAAARVASTIQTFGLDQPTTTRLPDPACCTPYRLAQALRQDCQHAAEVFSCCHVAACSVMRSPRESSRCIKSSFVQCTWLIMWAGVLLGNPGKRELAFSKDRFQNCDSDQILCSGSRNDQNRQKDRIFAKPATKHIQRNFS